MVKHFPGEGQASANSDYSPASTPSLPSLEKSDLGPFSEAIHSELPAVMVGNAIIPGLTTGPASLSPAAIGDLLRRQLGFGGLVVTDSLSARAISSTGLDVPHMRRSKQCSPVPTWFCTTSHSQRLTLQRW